MGWILKNNPDATTDTIGAATKWIDKLIPIKPCKRIRQVLAWLSRITGTGKKKTIDVDEIRKASE